MFAYDSAFELNYGVFSRSAWDEEYEAVYAQAVVRPVAVGLEAQLGQALQAGSIYVDLAAGSLHPRYAGFSGHVQGMDGLFSWGGQQNPNPYPVSDPAGMSAQIKRVARFYGADLVGICRVDRRWIYSHYYDRETGAYGPLDIDYRYAVVMGVEMDRQAIEQSPGFEASSATALGYSRMAEVAPSLAAYIRGLGYPAVPSGNDTGQSIPLAIDAGLGELGRNGLLVTPQFGPRQRICKVFTDLPLQPDRPIDFGLQRWCVKCGLCARRCPVGAVRKEDRTTELTSVSNRPGILRWPVDVARCYIFWKENGCSCSNCVAACPWGWGYRRWLEA